MPNGKTIPQYRGLYVNAVLLKTYFQNARINRRGTHHVPNDQKNSVNPFVNAEKSEKAPPIFGMLWHSTAPARVVMASAPILIQYGGTKASGVNLKNTSL